jgi:hypothetical protein
LKPGFSKRQPDCGLLIKGYGQDRTGKHQKQNLSNIEEIVDPELTQQQNFVRFIKIEHSSKIQIQEFKSKAMATLITVIASTNNEKWRGNHLWNYDTDEPQFKVKLDKLKVWRYRWLQKLKNSEEFVEIDLAKQIYDFYNNNGRTLSNSFLMEDKFENTFKVLTKEEAQTAKQNAENENRKQTF